jgi:L-threonylcarbamoyladenylate synthase
MEKKSFPNREALQRAAALIRAGGLVAFPTETVYGLGANALDREAVERIFRAKGRPSTSPLIVHVSSLEMARALVENWPEAAEALALRFWPGPLTLVLRKRDVVPDVVTAGLPTVGLRVPAHPVALELIREAGVPIAAPSANRFSRLSPTTADHVLESMGDSVDLVLDGGAAEIGIESTVLSLAGGPVLFRPGAVTRQEIEALIGPVRAAGRIESGAAHPAPGLHSRHYSPSTPLVVVERGELPAGGRGAYLWVCRPAAAAKPVRMPGDARQYASLLYETLHRLDAEGWDWIAVERPPEGPDWAAVADRIGRASVNRPSGRS